MADHLYRNLLLAEVALWLAARLFFWNGYYSEDAPGYVTDALWAVLGQYHTRDHVNGLNVGTYLPVALPLMAMGKSEAALGIWPLACSLLGLLSSAALARCLFGSLAGLLAGALYAVAPGDVFFSTVVMPDAMQAGWSAVSMFLIVSAFSGSGQAQLRPRLVAAGAALGVCHLMRANDVLLVPAGVAAVVCCATIWHRRPRASAAASCLAFVSGWVLVLVAEGAVYAWTAGDFLHRFHVVTRHYGTTASIAQAGLNVDPMTIPYSIFAPLLWVRDGVWWHFNPDQSYHALLFCWALVAAVAGLVLVWLPACAEARRARAGMLLTTLWLAWPLAFQQFGSQSLVEYVPMHRLSRHLVVVGPAAIATIAGAFGIAAARLLRARPATVAAAAALAAIWLAVHVSFNWRAEQVAYSGYHRIKDTYVRIRAHLPPGVRAIVADPGDLCFFDFWMNPAGFERVRMVPFAAYSGCEEIQDAVVLTDSNPGWERMAAPVIQQTVARLPCLVAPPPAWQLVYDGHPEKVFFAPPDERNERH